MIIKVLLTIIFLVVMIGVGVYTRKQASRATQDSSDGNMVCHLRGLVSAMPSSVRCWPGFF